MKRSTFSILFYIKRTKLLKNGEAPVYMKITINGKSAEVSLKRSIDPDVWNPKKNKAKGKSPEAKSLNEYLQGIEVQIYLHHKTLLDEGQQITAAGLRAAFTGHSDSDLTLLKLFKDHTNEILLLIGKDYSRRTYHGYLTSMRHLTNFIKKKFRSNDCVLSKVDHAFIKGFEVFLKTEYGCQHNSAMKHIKRLKKVIRIGLANDYMDRDPFANYKITTKPVERNPLSENEIETLLNKEISIQRLAIVRDTFIFQCYSGLAYKDVAELEPDNIQIGIDGKKWIFVRRHKTGNPCHIPLLPIAEMILDKYKEHPCRHGSKLLPVPSNQKMNAYLKEIADICGIGLKLHSHLARHTFATTVTLSNGIPIETVARLLGHKDLQSTRIYAQVLDTKISKETSILREKYV